MGTWQAVGLAAIHENSPHLERGFRAWIAAR